MRAAALAIVLVLASFVGRADAATGPSIHAEWRVESPADAAPSALAFAVELEDGWHVNAHDPDRPYLISTELTVEPPPGATVESIEYPQPVIRQLRFAAGGPLRLYEGRFAIGVHLRGATAGAVTGRLRYQAGNDESCLPPRTLPVTLTLGAAPVIGLAPAPVVGDAAGEQRSRIEGWMRERGLAVTLALAALFGLGLNLTPCVYPLISVTIAYFGGQSRRATGRVLTLAGAYVLGIATTFSVLGVAAALSGGVFGGALQRPGVLAAIALLLVALAASNFGLYQLRAPAFVATRVGRSSHGVVGALLMGLTMGIVAAPCVGPIVIGLLLFVAARQDALLGFALFFALALGMGAPYLALATVAGSIRKLPRSGEWLLWVEHLFGFVLLGMALYFATPLLGDRVAAAITPLLLAIAGMYLGFVGPAGRDGAFTIVRRIVAVIAVGAAVWVAVPHRAESAIAWQAFSPDALADAARAGRPALVDFSARWCLPCRENDTMTFVDSTVATEAERFAMLRADVTEMTPDREAWMQRFHVLGVPTILLFGSSGAEEARTVGFVAAPRLAAMMRDRR